MSRMLQMWAQFTVYQSMVKAAINKNRVDSCLRAEFEELLVQLENSPRNPPLDYFPHASPVARRMHNSNTAASLRGFGGGNAPPRSFHSTDAAGAATAADDGGTLNVDHLRRFWTAPVIVSRDEWLQWLATLRTQILRQSPSFALRTCAPLAEIHEALAK